MMYWHGPWCAKPQDNAFGFRRTGFEFWIHSYWEKAADREKSLAWVEQFFGAMEPLSTGAVYVNDLENEGEARVRAAYGDKYRSAGADQAEIRSRQFLSRSIRTSRRPRNS